MACILTIALPLIHSVILGKAQCLLGLHHHRHHQKPLLSTCYMESTMPNIFRDSCHLGLGSSVLSALTPPHFTHQEAQPGDSAPVGSLLVPPLEDAGLPRCPGFSQSECEGTGLCLHFFQEHSQATRAAAPAAPLCCWARLEISGSFSEFLGLSENVCILLLPCASGNRGKRNQGMAPRPQCSKGLVCQSNSSSVPAQGQAWASCFPCGAGGGGPPSCHVTVPVSGASRRQSSILPGPEKEQYLPTPTKGRKSWLGGMFSWL